MYFVAFNAPLLAVNFHIVLLADFSYEEHYKKAELEKIPEFQRNFTITKFKLVFYMLLVFLCVINFIGAFVKINRGNPFN